MSSAERPDSTPAELDPAAISLAEEELVIDTQLVQTGRARLVKRVEVETVTRTIELRREVLHIERVDPALNAGETDASGDGVGSEVVVLEGGPLAPGSFQDGSLDVVLMQEEAVISTQLVPRERVRLSKEIVTERHPVQAELQAERVDLEERQVP